MAHRHAISDSSQAPATEGNVLRWARFYNPLTSLLTLGNRAGLRRETIGLAEIPPAAAVLDVGCGTGDVALAARRHMGAAGRVCGIDPAPEMIAFAREQSARARADVDFQVGVIESLPFPSASFDVVLSSLMMHHLPPQLKQRGMAEILRVLRPGGRVLIVDVKRPPTWLRHVLAHLFGHMSVDMSVEDLPVLLRAAGFVDVRGGSLRLRALGFASAQKPRS